MIRYDAKTCEDFDWRCNEKIGTRQTKTPRGLECDRQGWLGSPDDAESLAEIQRLAKAKRRFTTCLVIGIGGSDLGTRAAWHAIQSRTGGMRLEYAGGNTDPDGLEDTLARIDWKKTLVNIISKSGDTLEPMATFFVVREMLKKKVGRAFSDHIVATTDASHGAPRDLAIRRGLCNARHPKKIGGRFSVLTSVGLFPLCCAGSRREGDAPRRARNPRRVYHTIAIDE